MKDKRLKDRILVRNTARLITKEELEAVTGGAAEPPPTSYCTSEGQCDEDPKK